MKRSWSLFSPDDLYLLAQEVTALLLCIDDNHYYHCCYGYDQEDFHIPRIARSPKNVLYSRFANEKQLCKPVLTRSSGRSIIYPLLISHPRLVNRFGLPLPGRWNSHENSRNRRTTKPFARSTRRTLEEIPNRAKALPCRIFQ